MLRGIDVSAYQSSSYATDGLFFVFIKATEGRSYINPRVGVQTQHGRKRRPRRRLLPLPLAGPSPGQGGLLRREGLLESRVGQVVTDCRAGTPVDA